MILLPFFIVIIIFTFFIELMYGIFHFNYNIQPSQLIKTRQYAVLAEHNYKKYKATKNDVYKQKVINAINEIEKYMDVYDVKYNFGIDLIDIKKELIIKN